MPSDVFKRRNLFWKEWREKRSLALWMLLFPMAGLFVEYAYNSIDGEYVLDPPMLDGVAGMAGGLLLACVLTGLRLYSLSEIDLLRSPYAALPIRRWRFAFVKILSASAIFIPLGLAGISLAGWVNFSFFEDSVSFADYLFPANLLALAGALPVVFITATQRRHTCSMIPAFLFSLLHIAFVTALLYFGASLYSMDDYMKYATRYTIVFALVASLISMCWFIFLVSRTRLQEYSGPSRFVLGLLYTATLYELLFTLLLANPRDIAMLIFG